MSNDVYVRSAEPECYPDWGSRGLRWTCWLGLDVKRMTSDFVGCAMSFGR